MEKLTIGKVAKLAGVGVETIRFYERRGLIDQPQRKNSSYRQYPEETVGRLRFINRAKGLGFTLKETKDLLSLQLDSPSTAVCEEVRKLAEEKLVAIQDRIMTLQAMDAVIVGLIESCRDRTVTCNCPILDALKK
jgi:Hg(II)-responsive transcriptional regulator